MRNGYISIFLAVALMVFAFGCTSSSGGQASDESGSLKFSIDVADEAANPFMAAVDCTAMRIDTVIAELRDSKNNLIATGGPWPCTTRQGAMTSIPAGEGYTLIIMMKNSEGVVRYQGFVYNITVPAAGVADAGTVTVSEKNSPPVIDRIADQRVISGQTMTFEVIASDPDGNNLTYYMTNPPEDNDGQMFESAVFDPQTYTFTWQTSGQGFESGAYLVWFVVTDDGIPRRSAWKRVKLFVDPVGATIADLQLIMKTDNDTIEVAGRKFAVEDEQFIMQLKDGSNTAHLEQDLFFGVEPQEKGIIDSSTYSWTPSSTDIGNHLLRFWIGGEGYEDDYKKILLTVGGGNAAPLLEPVGTKRFMKVDETYEFYITAEDPDSGNLTFSAITFGEHYNPFEYAATFDASTQKFSWTPTEAAGEVRDFGLRFTVSDDSGGSDTWDMEMIVQ